MKPDPGAKVESYVSPTNLDPSVVGFDNLDESRSQGWPS